MDEDYDEDDGCLYDEWFELLEFVDLCEGVEFVVVDEFCYCCYVDQGYYDECVVQDEWFQGFGDCDCEQDLLGFCFYGFGCFYDFGGNGYQVLFYDVFDCECCSQVDDECFGGGFDVVVYDELCEWLGYSYEDDEGDWMEEVYCEIDEV